PMVAALSANHLAALLLPPALCRLYIACDADAAGDMALAALTERAEEAGIEALALSPRRGDFSEDLRAFGPRALHRTLRIQLAPPDVVRFMGPGAVMRDRKLRSLFGCQPSTPKDYPA
ncbi:toprim domain-containing protein, partial [Rhizobiaceae sp. 2RAB30]